MSAGHGHRRTRLQSIQVEDGDELRIVVSYQKPVVIVSDSHLGWCVVRSQRGDLAVCGPVENQHLVPILPQHIELIANWIRKDVDQRAGNVDDGSPLVRAARIHKHTDGVRKIDGRRGRDLQCRGGGAVVIQESGWIDANLNDRRSDSGGGLHADSGSRCGDGEGSLVAAGIEYRKVLGSHAARAVAAGEKQVALAGLDLRSGG